MSRKVEGISKEMKPMSRKVEGMSGEMKTHEQEGGGYVWGKCKSLLGLAVCGQKVSAELKGAWPIT